MKKFRNFAFLLTLLVLTMSAMPANKAMKKTQSIVNVFVANGTNFFAYCKVGATTINVNPTSSSTGQVNTGTYTVTLHTDQGGSHQYMFTGQTTQTNSTGTAIWTNVSITGNSNASIY